MCWLAAAAAAASEESKFFIRFDAGKKGCVGKCFTQRSLVLCAILCSKKWSPFLGFRREIPSDLNRFSNGFEKNSIRLLRKGFSRIGAHQNDEKDFF